MNHSVNQATNQATNQFDNLLVYPRSFVLLQQIESVSQSLTQAILDNALNQQLHVQMNNGVFPEQNVLSRQLQV